MGTIQVNKEQLEELRNSFATTSGSLNAACVVAKSAEYVGHSRDVKTIDSNNNRVCKKVGDLTGIIDTIVEGFSTSDEKLKKKAEQLGNEYIGSAYYPAISGGATVSINAETNEVSVLYLDRLKDYKGVVQPNSYDCTSCSTTTMLQRWLVIHGKDAGLDYRNVKSQMGGTWCINPANDIVYDGTSFDLVGYGNKYSNAGNELLVQKSPTGNRQEGLANLLSEHPEGIVFYSHYSDKREANDDWSNPHAITITKAIQNANGSYQFYAQDPALGGDEVRLEDSWLFKNHQSYYGSIDGLLNTAICVQYIQSVY